MAKQPIPTITGPRIHYGHTSVKGMSYKTDWQKQSTKNKPPISPEEESDRYKRQLQLDSEATQAEKLCKLIAGERISSEPQKCSPEEIVPVSARLAWIAKQKKRHDEREAKKAAKQVTA